MEKRLVKIAIVNVAIVTSIVVLAYFLFRDVEGLFSTILILAAVMFVVPIALIKYYEVWKIKSLEDYFPQFMGDLVETGRITSTIIESHRFGGNLTDVFESISSTAIEIERLREERKLYINSQLMTGYIIFFVFLLVMIGLQKFLVPTLGDVSIGEITSPMEGIETQYNEMFRNLIVIQGLFAGLVIGKMAEASVVAGVKHSLVLLIVGVLVYTLSGFF